MEMLLCAVQKYTKNSPRLALCYVVVLRIFVNISMTVPQVEVMEQCHTL